MAEQFDVKLAEGAGHRTPRSGYRGKTWTWDHDEESQGILPKEG